MMNLISKKSALLPKMDKLKDANTKVIEKILKARLRVKKMKAHV